jgi:hypothetical protein
MRFQTICCSRWRVDEVVHELGLRLRVALDQLEGMFVCLFTEVIVQQHPRPSEDHVQRRAQSPVRTICRIALICKVL